MAKLKKQEETSLKYIPHSRPTLGEEEVKAVSVKPYRRLSPQEILPKGKSSPGLKKRLQKKWVFGMPWR
jgi:hypothetical protein